MIKPTPGPWLLDSAGWPLIINGATNDDDTEGNMVCEVDCVENSHRGYHYNEEEAAANARLIAAAPELLDALTELAREYEAIVENPWSWYPELVKAKVAIAKAKEAA